jgi:hypothetical protein
MLTMAQAVEVIERALRPFAGKPGAKTLAALGVVREIDRLAVRRAIYTTLRGLGYEVKGAPLVIEGSTTVWSLAKVLVAKSRKVRAKDAVRRIGGGGMEHRPIGSSVFEKGGSAVSGGRRSESAGGLRLSLHPGGNLATLGNGGGVRSPRPGWNLPDVPVQKTVVKKVVAKKAVAAKKAVSKAVASTVTVTATPHVEFGEEPTKGTRYPLEVFLNQEAAEAGSEVQGVAVTVPSSVKSCRIEVWADASSHFVVEGLGSDSHVMLSVKTGVSDRLPCVLRMLGGAKAEKAKGLPMFVAFFLRYNGRPCGKVMRYLEMVDGRLRWRLKPEPAIRAVAGALLPRSETAAALVVEHGARRADIAVEVLRTEANDGRQFRLHCVTKQGEWTGAWNLPMATSDLVNAYVESVMDTEEGGLVAALDGAGLNLWKALKNNAPAAAKLIVDALAAGAKTMSVISEEAFIPWELMVPELTDKDRSLGTRLQLGRWVTGEYIAPPQRIPMQTGYIVAPTTSSLKSLAGEVKFLKKQLHPGVEVRPANRVGLNKELGKKARDVVHFICHGKSEVLQKLILEGTDELDSSAVLGMRGVRKGFTARPLVFLNACEVGGQRLSLDGAGGFAHAFIELNAAAVVAPLWAVEDEAAGLVTTSFYTDVLKGVPLAKALQRIRQRAYSEGATMDSFAAYCLYGDPLAVAVTE